MTYLDYVNAAPKAPRKAPPAGAFSLTDSGRFPWEHRDCAVRAMSAALGKSYEACHAALKAAGRVDRRGTYAHTLEKAMGLPYRVTARCTYAQWLEHHRVGIYLVFVTGHFFAVINGRQLDMGPSLYRPRSRMHGFWTITA